MSRQCGFFLLREEVIFCYIIKKAAYGAEHNAEAKSLLRIPRWLAKNERRNKYVKKG
jgi:hypothetical protein